MRQKGARFVRREPVMCLRVSSRVEWAKAKGEHGMLDFTYEEAAASRGFTTVCGVDEAGRGPLAGPVCAAAVILPQGFALEGLDDSKKLTPRQRDRMYDVITQQALAWGWAFADEKEIDRINILQATFEAMRSAVDGLKLRPQAALVDGNLDPRLSVPAICIVHGDAKSPSVAAASVIAKVTRDRYMLKLDALYPQYHFAQHKGYGTKLHYEMLRQFGPSPVHRMSFLKNL